MVFYVQQLFNGITLGSLYALIAIGYTMVYGILRLINFAHGDIFMWAGYWVFFSFFCFTCPGGSGLSSRWFLPLGWGWRSSDSPTGLLGRLPESPSSSPQLEHRSSWKT